MAIAFIPPPLLPRLPSTTLPRIICCAEPPPSNSPLTLALSAAPVAVGMGAGAPVFAAVYLPLLAIGLAVEASPAAILFLSTLLFAAGALLVDDIPNIVAVTLANGGIAAALLWTEQNELAMLESAPRAGDADRIELFNFDQRLEAAAKRRGSGPRMMADGDEANRRGSGGPRMMADGDEEPEEAPKKASLLDKLEKLADASWDMFVMPGEYANSRYDRFGAEAATKELKEEPAKEERPTPTTTTPGGSSKQYDFTGAGDAFEGNRVLEMRKKKMEKKRATPRQVVSNVLEQGPQGVLILMFLLLTVGDVIFNLSRQFICFFPDLCRPADML